MAQSTIKPSDAVEDKTPANVPVKPDTAVADLTVG